MSERTGSCQSVNLQGRPQRLRQVRVTIAQVVRDMTAEDVDKALSEEDAWMLALFQGTSPCRRRATVHNSLERPALGWAPGGASVSAALRTTPTQACTPQCTFASPD